MRGGKTKFKNKSQGQPQKLSQTDRHGHADRQTEWFLVMHLAAKTPERGNENQTG